MLVQGEVSELNSIKPQTPRKKESDSEGSKAAFGNSFRYRGWTQEVLAKTKNAKRRRLKRKVVC